MTVRLVATDLDGTLVRSNGTVSDRTRRALDAAEDAGIDVVFVTGRPLRWAREVFHHVGGHGQAVISNGALVWDVGRDRPLQVRGLAPETAVEVADRLRAAIPGSAFAVETLAGIGLEDDFLERYPVPDGSRRGALEDLLSDREPVVKILARHEQLSPQEFWDAADELVGDLVETTWSSAGTLLEMSARGVTKASTLALLADERGVGAEDVVAFGDMPNDLPMLEWAGTSYAMANAHPTVLAAADDVAPGNDDDGVAVVLERILGR
ncbi:MAG TPA: HAD family hydrolase [Marmoricola sp.]|jgi:Cof subfamily protein (haloacid dehalogenase superfamily)|nr:HAD family hydrolase [Marmoricola sp.]